MTQTIPCNTSYDIMIGVALQCGVANVSGSKAVKVSVHHDARGSKWWVAWCEVLPGYRNLILLLNERPHSAGN